MGVHRQRCGERRGDRRMGIAAGNLNSSELLDQPARPSHHLSQKKVLYMREFSRAPQKNVWQVQIASNLRKCVLACRPGKHKRFPPIWGLHPEAACISVHATGRTRVSTSNVPLTPLLGTRPRTRTPTSRARPSREKDAELQRTGLAPPRHARVEARVAATGGLVLAPPLPPRAIPRKKYGATKRNQATNLATRCTCGFER